METRLEEVQSQNSLLETQYVTAREELTERSCEITRLEEDAVKQSQLEEIIATLEMKLSLTVEENVKLETNHRKIIEDKDNDINQLLQEKNCFETTLKQLSDNKEKVETEMVQVSSQTKQLKASLDQLVEENKQLQSDMKAFTEEKQKIDQMTVEKHEAESNLRQVIEEKAQLDVTLSLIIQDKIQLEAKLSELITEKNNSVTSLNRVIEEKQQVEVNNNQLAEENIKLQSSLHQLTEEKLLIQESIERHEDEVTALKGENDCIRSALLSAEQELQRLKEQLKMMDKRTEEENRERSAHHLLYTMVKMNGGFKSFCINILLCCVTGAKSLRWSRQSCIRNW